MSIVRHGRDGLGEVALGGNEVADTGLEGLALEVEVDALLTSLALLLGVLLDALDEVLAGAGVLDVLDADADALLHVAVADDLVQEDADGGLGDVVDDAGLAVVDLVGHTRWSQHSFSRSFLWWCCFCPEVGSGEKRCGRRRNGGLLTPSGRHC